MNEEVKKASPVDRVGRLNNLVSVRKELVRLYKQARKGEVPIADASKLANMLQIVGNLIKDSTIDQLAERLEKLEGK